MNSQLRLHLPILLAATITIAALIPVLANDLVWDDRLFITDSRKAGQLAHLPEALTVPFWDNATSSDGDFKSYWRPLTTFILWTGTFIGNKTPSVFHLISLLALFGAGGALFRLTRTLVPSDDGRLAGIWIALLYVSHPVAGELLGMVANVSDHLVLIFMLLAIVEAIKIIRGDTDARRYLLVAVYGVLACASKEFGYLSIGVPLAAWLFVRATDRPSHHPSSWNLPLWIAALAPVVLFLFARVLVLNDFLNSFSPVVVPAQLFLSIGAAAGQIFLFNAAGLSSYTVLNPDHIMQWAMSAAVVLVFGTAAAYRLFQKRQLEIWMFSPIFGVILFWVSVAGSSISDTAIILPVRFIHLILAGALIGAIPLLIRYALNRYQWILTLVVCLLAVFSFTRVVQWKDEVTFFENEHAQHPDDIYPWHMLLTALIKAEQYDQALTVLDKYQRKFVTLSPRQEEIRLVHLSQIALKKEPDSQLATTIAHKALINNPRSFRLLMNLVNIRGAAGHPEESVELMKHALTLPWYTPRQRQQMEKNISDFMEYRRRQPPVDKQVVPAP